MLTAIFLLVLMCLGGFIVYYVWRLSRLRGREDDVAIRFRSYLKNHEPDGSTTANTIDRSMAVMATPGPMNKGPGSAKIYEWTVGLRALAPGAVFMSCDRAGEINFQLGERPLLPLRLLLDVRAQKVLREIAAQATLDFGPCWSILADEDDQGRLQIIRLS